MVTKTDNSSVDLKLGIRRWVASQIDGWSVLDLYCGASGEMYKGIWHKAHRYFGTDKYSPHSLAPTARMSAEMATQSLNLDEFNIFDVDCYASPWIVARRILRRRGPGRFGLILTNGESRGLRNGTTNEIVRVTLGVSGLSDLRLLGRYQELVNGLMIRSLGEINGIRLTRGAWSTLRKVAGNEMYYIGLIVDKSGEV